MPSRVYGSASYRTPERVLPAGSVAFSAGHTMAGLFPKDKWNRVDSDECQRHKGARQRKEHLFKDCM